MYFSDDRSCRMIFDQVSESYLEARPEYPQEIYVDMHTMLFSGDSNSQLAHVLEIGSGSGQASEKLSNISKSLDCIEPGKNFIKLLNTKFKDNDAVKAHQCTFEEYQTDQKYDLIFSGCALHWIPKETVLDKSEKLLNSDGWIVGVWNMPKFEPAIYELIERIIHPLYPDFDIPRGTQEQIDYFDVGYEALSNQKWVKYNQKKIYYQNRSLNNELLLKLIWSYMDLSALGAENVGLVYQQLDDEIQALGIEAHSVENCYPLAMAQKL